MKKNLIIPLIIGGIIFLLIVLLGTSYNSIVDLNENVENKYADISVQLERRADLIPNLVNTVKGYTKHENDIIDKITTARSNLVNADNMSEKIEADNQLTQALNNLFVIVENYPELKSNTNFIQLQDELAGTENRLAVARRDYNESVKEYNIVIKKFPKNIIASIFNFDEKEYFEAKETSNEVPNVSFE